ncbi:MULTISPECIES: tRNA-uridine aminocarboxypropyltransferase [unclassified Arsukibacterium]|uniref:tRNA-uridine aminocarboxypropyltransferase n=1 Tax=unclassified Arsukibacterium TaxID=2635278 RepID=UPI000C5340A2|nr:MULTISPECIES: DTW domain-containing protein [unclassified Arsukibacterium]MAA96595.1 DTW domain-containing protein [Rheinheimera sp.]MBM34567.1 DTW domain-containing protein [Rheinheimera sp.]HAW94294.1 DTW domain-containing protein [Candidatus Azambacteria bacterium]|tara:strand:- start:2196 stop:2906 length:711 start_codon:yes stop_codon:yes gene_type:complete
MSQPLTPSRNAVLELRTEQLAKSQRVFNARGSKVIRCGLCLLPVSQCICAAKPEAAGNCAFCFIMYTGECYKPSNTGRLICDVIADNHAFVWDRTRPDPALLTLLNDQRYAPVLVFPQQYAAPERCLQNSDQLRHATLGKIPLFVMLDGTWREAKKMFKSPYLAKLPVLGIQPEQASRYALREAAHLHQLCTAEVAIEVLIMADEVNAANRLAEYFSQFRRAYLVGKPHLNLTEPV